MTNYFIIVVKTFTGFSCFTFKTLFLRTANYLGMAMGKGYTVTDTAGGGCLTVITELGYEQLRVILQGDNGLPLAIRCVCLGHSGIKFCLYVVYKR